ncbi:restriction endonuclease [Pallidibacillus thermolactis]|jgi:restriction system protein|uniref:restriction endonuclease n=1 Tax=Pallidibacillus thermolactis TaxID=251051 RepID=UPI00156B5C81|nr:restriction endonuclease [Pallidibacillus thermolactis]MCU9601749.1 restriction endonuclease [Pallidibacillus thermolactis subsp. kokeshiiformis]
MVDIFWSAFWGIFSDVILFCFLFVLSCCLIAYIIKQAKENRYLKELAKSGMKEIDRMDGLQFEVYLKALFREIGYRPLVTKSSHDFGADLIMKKHDKKIVIQAKRYSYRNKVGIEAVQQIYSAKAYYKADECWVITNSSFTKSAEKLASACNVKLIDRKKLVHLINKINPSVSAKKVIETVKPQSRKCPNCSGELVQRKSKTGNLFMGCSNYPSCTYTENVAK